jgi:hypothetical protein
MVNHTNTNSATATQTASNPDQISASFNAPKRIETATPDMEVISPVPKDYSTDVVSESCLELATNTICYLLSDSLPHLFLAPEDMPSHDSLVSPSFSEAGILMQQRIRHFYNFVRKAASITTAETLHTIFLLDRLIQIEAKSAALGGGTVIADTNIGTLLLVAVLLSTKMHRDIPFRNSWFSKVFGVPLAVLNQSEIVFMKKLGYRLEMTEDQYWSLYTTLVDE